MATGSDLGTHGELAIGNAQKGMRHDDMHVRVGVFVWAVLGMGGWIIAQVVLPTSVSLPVWAAALIAIFSGIIAVTVSVFLARSNARKKDQALSEIRAIDEAEKLRQMNAFKTAIRENKTDEQQ